jgi:5-methylcytosine-specific restriction protein A
MSSPDSVPPLAPGTVLTNRQLAELFGCSTQGGMRRAKRTNALVITSSRDGVYLDRWQEGVLHYTGMGLSGNQSLARAQNKTLAESSTNGVAVYLFEVFAPNEYTFLGRAVLDAEPYQEGQPDQHGALRQVWMFPLRLADGGTPAVPGASLRRAAERREKRARRLSDAELAERASSTTAEPSRREVVSATYERDPYVVELAKRRAQGHCQLCVQPAPFRNKQGEAFLETHHIEWLSRGGHDSIDNTVAVCPNCHRKLHVLDDEKDVAVVKARISAENASA